MQEGALGKHGGGPDSLARRGLVSLAKNRLTQRVPRNRFLVKLLAIKRAEEKRISCGCFAEDELNKDKDEIGREKEPWCCVGYIDQL